ncbi:MAG: sigma-70 family RNA polymerase sigma factor [Planctomycetota bacterium]
MLDAMSASRTQPGGVQVPNLQETIQLLQRARQGDKEALGRLYARYGERLRTIVRLRLGPRLRLKLESCDVVQEALLASLRQVDQAQFASSGAFLRWLSKLAENRIRDEAERYAAQKRDAARETPLEIRLPATDSVAGPIADLATFTTPSQVAARAEDLRRLETAIDALPEDQKEALLLVRYEGMSLAEAGEHLRRSPDAVRMLIARALARLATTLGADAAM